MWFKSRWIISKKSDHPVFQIASYLIYAILLVEMVFIIPGLSTGLGIVADYVLIGGLYSLGMVILYRIASRLLRFFYIANCSGFVVGLIALVIQTFLITSNINWGIKASFLTTGILTVLAILICLLLGYIFVYHRLFVLPALFFIAVCGVSTAEYIKQEQLSNAVPIVEPDILHSILVEQTEQYKYVPEHLAINPAEKGKYSVKKLDYHSSLEELEDKQQQYVQHYEDDDLSEAKSSEPNVIEEEKIQPTYESKEQLQMQLEWNEEQSIYIEPVDGSRLLTDWSWAKELYWGFSEPEIPIRGRLWVPEGDGPFPIVFIMHGNHISEDDSSAGYNYLGELIASHGMIVSSIDANFLNFSVWSGIVDNDQLLRAWLYLAHLDAFYSLDDSPLNIDWDKVSLIGHSRGGQAAAMAVDADNWLPDYEIIEILDDVDIQSVIAIAPTDYTVNSKLATLEDVSYLTIHGTLDSDLTEFYGERQYERTRLVDDHFKSAVMIYGANHGQFNEMWGKYDEQFPGALLLNTEHLLKEQDQQEIAKVFINGFLLSTLKEKNEYRKLFQDYRSASQWLPVTGYVTQYEDTYMRSLYDFEMENEADDLIKSSRTQTEVITLKGRNGTSKQNKVLKVKWDIGYSKLTIPLKASHKNILSDDEVEAFVIQMAKVTGSESEEDIAELRLDIDFVTDQATARLSLNQSYLMLDPYVPEYLKLDWLEEEIKKGKYDGDIEPYLQTYIIPVSIIKEHVIANREWNLEHVQNIQIWFKPVFGSVVIDDIGVVTKGGSYVKYE